MSCAFSRPNRRQNVISPAHVTVPHPQPSPLSSSPSPCPPSWAKIKLSGATFWRLQTWKLCKMHCQLLPTFFLHCAYVTWTAVLAMQPAQPLHLPCRTLALPLAALSFLLALALLADFVVVSLSLSLYSFFGPYCFGLKQKLYA